MYFANPWGLLGLLALPTIAFIHLYQRRYPPQYVGGLFLWATETQVRMPGRRRDRLPITRTLIVELLISLVLSLVLADPRFGEWDKATHLVAVLDHSASMQAQRPGEPSAREAAIRELEDRFQALPRSSVVTLIRTGVTPVTLARRATLEEARTALQSWQPTAPQHRFAPAWDELGQKLIQESGSILFLTDHLLDPREIPASLEVVSVGRKLDNVAIQTARWEFDSASVSGKIFVQVRNYGRDPAQCQLVIGSGGKTLTQKVLSISADGLSTDVFAVPGGLGTATVQIQKEVDGSQLDNQVQLVEPKVRTVRIATTLPKGNELREVQRVIKVTPDVTDVPVDQAHLLIGPANELPPSNPALWWLGLGPVSRNMADLAAAKDLLGPYLIDKRHPLAEGLSLGGVVWGGVQPVQYDLMPVVSAGQTPLLGQLRGTRTTGFLLNIDLSKSNLTESPDWPVLIDNLVEQRRAALPGLSRWNYRVGEVVQFRLFEGPDAAPAPALTLQGPRGVRKLVRESTVEIGDLQEPGIYTILQGEETWGKFAVNFFDAAESDLRELHPGRQRPKTVTTNSGITLDNPYTWAIWVGTILILCLLFADWFELRPRPLQSAAARSR